MWHVEGTLNPADIETKGKTVHELKASEWITGPACLCESEESSSKSCPHWFQQKTDGSEQIFRVVFEEINIEWEKLRSFKKMIRVFAYCLRFKSHSRDIVLTVEELERLSRALPSKIQMDDFRLAYQALASNKPLAVSDLLNKLSPFLHFQNIMRLRGRLFFLKRTTAWSIQFCYMLSIQ